MSEEEEMIKYLDKVLEEEDLSPKAISTPPAEESHQPKPRQGFWTPWAVSSLPRRQSVGASSSKGEFSESRFTQELRQALEEDRNMDGPSNKNTKDREGKLAQSSVQKNSYNEDSEGGLAPINVAPDLVTWHDFQYPQEASSSGKLKKSTTLFFTMLG